MAGRGDLKAGRPGGGAKPGAESGAPDGPARVVKPGDWKAVAETAMKGFPLASFSMPGRTPPKLTPAETQIGELTKRIHRAEEAHKQALQKAAREGEAAARAAHAAGLEEGRRNGERQAWDKYAKALEELRINAQGVLGELSRQKAALFLEFEEQAVALASGCIRRVFEGFAEGHSEAVLPLLKKAVAALGQVSVITIKVNPEDFRTVEENRPFWLPVEAGIQDIRIVPDDRIPRSACFVEADSTSAGLHAQEMAARIDEELRRTLAAKVQALRGPQSRSDPASVSGAPGVDPEAGMA